MSTNNSSHPYLEKTAKLFVQIALSIFSLLIFILYTLNLIRFDGFSLIIIAVVALLWMDSKILKAILQRISSIELLGNKITLADVRKEQEKLDEAGLLNESPGTIPAYLQFATTDPNLALAGLRIDIEKKLRAIADKHQLTSEGPEKTLSAAQLTRILVEHGLLSDDERRALNDLLTTLNQAVHGAQVSDEAAQWALEIGPRIISGLENR